MLLGALTPVTQCLWLEIKNDQIVIVLEIIDTEIPRKNSRVKCTAYHKSKVKSARAKKCEQNNWK